MKRFVLWVKSLFVRETTGAVRTIRKPSCLRCGREMYGSHFFYCEYCYDVLKHNHH